MSQQMYPTGSQQQFQPTYSTPQFGAAGQQFHQEIRQMAFSLHRLETALELARTRAIENRNPRVARLTGDLAAIAEAEKKLVVRRSPFARPIGQAAKQTIQQGVQELQQYVNDPEVREAISEAQQSASEIDDVLQRVQLRQLGQAAGYQPMFGVQTGLGVGPGSQRQQMRQDVRQTAMMIHNLETALQLAQAAALDQENVQVARLCGDLSVVAELEKKLVVRRSPFAQPIAEAVRGTIQEGIQNLQQHANLPEVQEVIAEAQQVVSTVQEDVAQLQTIQQQGPMGQWGQQGQPVGQPQQYGQPQHIGQVQPMPYGQPPLQSPQWQY